MNKTTLLKCALGLAAAAAVSAASAEITFYEYDNFGGRTFTTHDPVGDFHRMGFNDRASSVVVTDGPWEVCDDTGFRGRCIVLRPGNYPSLSVMNMGDRISSARELDPNVRYPDDRWAPPPLPGQATFYEAPHFHGRAFDTQSDVPDLRRLGFNDRASSVVVVGDRWEVCDDVGFAGHCIVLRPGRYPDLHAFGLDDRISSVRHLAVGARIDERRYAPPPTPAYDWRPRPQEQLFQAGVRSSHAVYGTPEQHCWVEREQIPQEQQRNQVGGAVIGGLIGGILGHQIGGDRTGTAVGAIGGAVVGAAVGGNADASRDVRRCAPSQVQGPPLYWDTVYDFHGIEHHVQTAGAPGPTITVNASGEPRL